MPKLKYFGKGLTPDVEKKAKLELGETSEIRIKSLQQIRSLIKEEPDFSPCLDEIFLLAFLRAKKFNVDEAFKLFKSHYAFKAKNWRIITGFKPSDYKNIWEEGHGIILEYMDDNDCGVGIQRFGMTSLDKYTDEEQLINALHCFEVGLQSEVVTVTGFVIIQDYANFSFKSMMRFAKPSMISKFVGIIQEYVPGRMKAVHIINAPEYVNIMLKISKMFLSKKLQERIHVHGDSLKSLHNYVTPEILPREYGGNQGPWTDCVQKFISEVFSSDSYIDKLNKYGYQGKTLQELRKNSAIPIHSTR